VLREALTLEGLRTLGPDDGAALLLAREMEGMTDSEQQLAATWLSEDEANRSALQRARGVWACFDGAEDNSIVAAMRDQALAPRRSFRFERRYAAAAAAILMLVGVSWWTLVAPHEPNGTVATVPADLPIRYASARGQIREFRLPDGSEMTLDADSLAVVHFTGRREIDLIRGRVLLAVAPDRARPLSVTANGYRIEDIGTRFDVNILGSSLTVTVLEGKAAVAPVTSRVQPAVVGAGQQLSIRGGVAALRTLGASTDMVAWRTGFLRFDDENLGDAVQMMNRYSNIEIVIADPDIAALRVSGQFRAGDAAGFAETIGELHRLDVARRGKRIEVTRSR
jgi:transmembrane sensor